MSGVDYLTKTPAFNLSGRTLQRAAQQKIGDQWLNSEPQSALNFITNSLGCSTQYSVIACDLGGAIVLWNEGARRVYGYESSEAVGRMNLSDLHTQEDVAADMPRRLMDIVLGHGKFEGSVMRIRKNGQPFTARLVKTLCRDAAGNPFGFLLVSLDVSEELRMAKYARSLIEASLDPLVTISELGIITDVNEATTKITGTPRETLIGSNFYSYFTEPEDAQRGCSRAFADGRVSDYPLTIRHANGEETDVLYNASVYCDECGNILGVVAAARDVTGQKQASQYARSLIEASPDPLVTINILGKITDVNVATVKVTGVCREALIGTDFTKYFTHPEKATEVYRDVFALGKVADYPLTIRHSGGKLTDVLYNASVYCDARGNVLGVFAAARDVTAQKQAEAQLAEQHDKDLERLAELERFQRLTVGRELKMIELKKEIELLKRAAI